MIITKECFKIVDADITFQNENESVWAIIALKDLSKLVLGSFYRPPDKGIQPLVDLEMELAQISEKFKVSVEKRLENIRRQNALEEKIIGSSIKNYKK